MKCWHYEENDIIYSSGDIYSLIHFQQIFFQSFDWTLTDLRAQIQSSKQLTARLLGKLKPKPDHVNHPNMYLIDLKMNK